MDADEPGRRPPLEGKDRQTAGVSRVLSQVLGGFLSKGPMFGSVGGGSPGELVGWYCICRATGFLEVEFVLESSHVESALYRRHDCTCCHLLGQDAAQHESDTH